MKIIRYNNEQNDEYYRLENDSGMTVQIGTFGACVQRVELSDSMGGSVNVCLGFEDPAMYQRNDLFSGATVAPVAGRIAGSRFAIGNKIYPLCTESEDNICLHGGTVNASFMKWDVMQAVVKDEEVCLGMSIVLPEDLEGFPGNRIFSATYHLGSDNCLTVDYDAVSDRDTYVAMTNHMYFNMSGDFTVSGLEQQLCVAADQYVMSDKDNLPVCLADVEGTPFDFRTPAVIKDKLAAYPDNEQTVKANGIDHAFDVRKASAANEMLAELKDPKSGRSVRVYSSTGEAMVVYTAGSAGDGYTLWDGVQSCNGCAVALESGAFPNAVNMPEFDPHILEGGKNYHHQIKYKFTF